MTLKDEAPRALEERAVMRVRDQHPDAAQLSPGTEPPNDLRTVLKEVVKELTVVLGRLDKLEALLGRGYHDDGDSPPEKASAKVMRGKNEG